MTNHNVEETDMIYIPTCPCVEIAARDGSDKAKALLNSIANAFFPGNQQAGMEILNRFLAARGFASAETPSATGDVITELLDAVPCYRAMSDYDTRLMKKVCPSCCFYHASANRSLADDLQVCVLLLKYPARILSLNNQQMRRTFQSKILFYGLHPANQQLKVFPLNVASLLFRAMEQKFSSGDTKLWDENQSVTVEQSCDFLREEIVTILRGRKPPFPAVEFYQAVKELLVSYGKIYDVDLSSAEILRLFQENRDAHTNEPEYLDSYKPFSVIIPGVVMVERVSVDRGAFLSSLEIDKLSGMSLSGNQEFHPYYRIMYADLTAYAPIHTEDAPASDGLTEVLSSDDADRIPDTPIPPADDSNEVVVVTQEPSVDSLSREDQMDGNQVFDDGSCCQPNSDAPHGTEPDIQPDDGYWYQDAPVFGNDAGMNEPPGDPSSLPAGEPSGDEGDEGSEAVPPSATPIMENTMLHTATGAMDICREIRDYTIFRAEPDDVHGFIRELIKYESWLAIERAYDGVSEGLFILGGKGIRACFIRMKDLSPSDIGLLLAHVSDIPIYTQSMAHLYHMLYWNHIYQPKHLHSLRSGYYMLNGAANNNPYPDRNLYDHLDITPETYAPSPLINLMSDYRKIYTAQQAFIEAEGKRARKTWATRQYYELATGTLLKEEQIPLTPTWPRFETEIVPDAYYKNGQQEVGTFLVLSFLEINRDGARLNDSGILAIYSYILGHTIWKTFRKVPFSLVFMNGEQITLYLPTSDRNLTNWFENSILSLFGSKFYKYYKLDPLRIKFKYTRPTIY